MGLLFSLAWRNIWRHPLRGGLTLAAIAFAAFVLVFMVTLQLGTYDLMIESNLRMLTGHFQVQSPGYHDKPQIRNVLTKPEVIAGTLRRLEGVEAATIRANGFALVSSEDRTYGAQVVGVQPGHENRLSILPGRISQGRFLADDQAHEAVIGAAFAHNLRLEVGGELTLLGSGRDGSIAAAVLRVVGIFESGAPELDRGLIQIPLGAFQDIFTMRDSAHAVAVLTGDLDRLPEVAQRARQVLAEESLGEWVILDWESLQPGLRQLVRADMAMSWVLYFCLIVVVVFSILNTFLMAVLERTREFGMMMALGIRPPRLAGLVMLESFFLTLAGLLLGLLVGGLVTWYFAIHGFSYPGMAEMAGEFGLPDKIYPQISLVAFGSGPLAILICTLLAALYPALRLWRLQPVEAMKAI